MNKILKAGLTVGAAALICASATAIAGCENNESIKKNESVYLSERYIVLEEKGVYTLHKGDLYYYSYGSGAAASGGIEFDCGYNGKDYGGYEEGRINSYQYVSYPTKPSEKTYDHKCEKCFGE